MRLIDERTCGRASVFPTALVVARGDYARGPATRMARLADAVGEEVDRARRLPDETRAAGGRRAGAPARQALPDALLAEAWRYVDFTRDPLLDALDVIADDATTLGLAPPSSHSDAHGVRQAAARRLRAAMRSEQLLARDPEARRGLGRERRLGDAGDEAVGGALQLVELHLEEVDPRDGVRSCARRAANCSRCVVTNACTPSSGRSDRTRRANLLSLGGVGPRAELVENHERAGVELVEEAADAQELHSQVPLGGVGTRLLVERREEARSARWMRPARRGARSPASAKVCAMAMAWSRRVLPPELGPVTTTTAAAGARTSHGTG